MGLPNERIKLEELFNEKTKKRILAEARKMASRNSSFRNLLDSWEFRAIAATIPNHRGQRSGMIAATLPI